MPRPRRDGAAPDTKNGHSHRVWLPAAARQVLAEYADDNKRIMIDDRTSAQQDAVSCRGI